MGTSLWNKFYALLKRVAKLEFRTLTTHVSRVINSKKRLLFSVYASQQNYPKYPLSIWMTHRQAVLEHPREKLAQFISSCLGFILSQEAASSCFSILFHKLFVSVTLT